MNEEDFKERVMEEGHKAFKIILEEHFKLSPADYDTVYCNLSPYTCGYLGEDATVHKLSFRAGIVGVNYYIHGPLNKDYEHFATKTSLQIGKFEVGPMSGCGYRSGKMENIVTHLVEDVSRFL